MVKEANQELYRRFRAFATLQCIAPPRFKDGLFREKMVCSGIECRNSIAPGGAMHAQESLYEHVGHLSDHAKGFFGIVRGQVLV